MKWLIGFLVALFMVSAAMAGEDPYIAIVGNDIAYNPFYFSMKYGQFLYDQESPEFSVPSCITNGTEGFLGQTGFIIPAYRTYPAGCEQFRSSNAVNQPEVCDLNGYPDSFFGEPNSRVTAFNTGIFQWYIRLPKKPNGEINIAIQCGILKPNAFALYQFDAVELCAAETGERVGPNCSRLEVGPGENPIIAAALPTLTVIAYPGPYATGAAPAVDANGQFLPFNLTAFRNPGPYDPVTNPMVNGIPLQVLNGSTDARILLKACFDKTVVAKLPVTGQVNALGQVENDLEAGDIIYVKLTVPRTSTTDIYCHAQSVRLMGIGEAP